MRLIFAVLLLFTITACGSPKESAEKANNEATEKKEEVVKNEYESIEKIIVPIEVEWVNGLIAYQEFNIEVIKQIAKKHNIPIELQEIANFEDAMIALEGGRVDVVLGVSETTNSNLETTYSYITTPLYLPNGVEAIMNKTYRMAVSKDNKGLLELLNDGIFTMKDNGELDKLQNEYLGERESKDHPTWNDLYDSVNDIPQQERDTLLKQLEEYTKSRKTIQN